MKRTLRLTFPEWQGGIEPSYYAGCKILDWLAPKTDRMICAQVPVSTTFSKDIPVTEGVSWKNELMEQQKRAYEICAQHDPDRIIVLGGDCSVEQAPFDYLHGKYPEHTAIVWIDAHPDFSRPKDFSHEHAMVLGNLIGDGAPDFAAMVAHPFDKKDIIYAGIIADHLEPWEKAYQKSYQMNFLTPEQLCDNSSALIDWLRAGDYQQVLIHWDLDVLSPDDFRSLLCAEPYLPPPTYAVGRMRLEQIIRIIKDISQVVDVVALGITEFLPWDMMRLQQGLRELSIFRD
ncbi:arginase family protein [Agathobaculum sp. TL06]